MLRYNHVCVEKFDYVLPERVVTSAELERELAPIYERFGLHEGRLEMMTGIRERRFWNEGTLPSDASTRVGQKALEGANVAPEDIECLIHTSVSRDFLEPATASVVHHNLKLSPKALVYDISNACLGFLNGMISLANMIELGQVKRGLIVAGESSRNLVRTTIRQLLGTPRLNRQQFKAAFASLTIGSGAVAVVMAHDVVHAKAHVELDLQRLVLVDDLPLAERPLDSHFQFRIDQRLGQEVEGSSSDRLDGRFDRAVTGDHDHGRARMILAAVGQDVEPVAVAKPNV